MNILERGLALDIDEVISNTALCWMDIMLKKFGNPEKLSTKKFLKKYKLTKNVPYWQNEEQFAFLEKMRISNEFYESIPTIKNSVEYINKISRIIPISCFLTTRPEIIRKGTKKWLSDNGLPEAEIVMRPNKIKSKDGNKWKAKILDSLYPEVIGIIDDNPELISFLPKTYKGKVFLYGYEKYKSNGIKVIPCKNWKILLSKIKEISKIL